MSEILIWTNVAQQYLSTMCRIASRYCSTMLKICFVMGMEHFAL